LFGLEQLFHGDRLVKMVFGLGDLFTGDQEPHIRLHQVLRSSATSRVKLCQGDLRGGRPCSAAFSQMATVLIVAGAIDGTRKQRCGHRLCGTAGSASMNDRSTRSRYNFRLADPSLIWLWKSSRRYTRNLLGCGISPCNWHCSSVPNTTWLAVISEIRWRSRCGMLLHTALPGGR
jgi:hypothetical protein